MRMQSKYSLIKKILALFIGAVAFALITKLVIRSAEPEFLDVLLKKYKNDSELIDKIGGYRSYEVHYDEYEAKTDSMNFKIVIYGKAKKYVHYGLAVRKEENWRLKNVRDSILEYSF